MQWEEDDLEMYDPDEEERKPIKLYNEDDPDFDESEWIRDDDGLDFRDLSDFDGYGDYD